MKQTQKQEIEFLKQEIKTIKENMIWLLKTDRVLGEQIRNLQKGSHSHPDMPPEKRYT